ncbi:MAG: UvrD-helicase domain-containing protein [Limisphaerales bacterium]
MPTDAQLRAIRNLGNTVVVAGAGTGKTSTLVGRVLHWIAEEDASIDRLLLLTFTEASAAEMKQRLRDELNKRLAEAEIDDLIDHLNEQLALLEQAQISTLHSFCLRLVRDHFHVLGIDPDVRVLDEQQTRPLEERVLDDLIREHVTSSREDSLAIQRLIRVYTGGNDFLLRGWIKKIHRFARTLPDPAAWFAHELSECAREHPVHWEDWLMAEIGSWKDRWLQTLKPLRRHDEFVRHAYQALKEVPVQGFSWSIADALALVRKPGPRWKRGTPKSLKDTVNPVFDEAAHYRRLLDSTEGDSALLADWKQLRNDLVALLKLAREFGRRFDESKRLLGGIDFADQEQLVLRLLADENSGVAEHCRSEYQQVFIDEAQDINQAQDAILSAISHDNRFIVGDVKQCIYQFRLTDPRIFRRYAEDWSAIDAPGLTIPLVENFRSHEGVVNFVNRMFNDLMVPELGGLDYENEEQLNFGAREQRTNKTVSTDPTATRRVEINLLSTDINESQSDPDDDDTNLTAIELEARLVAQRLRRLMNETIPVFDQGDDEPRPVRWSDMAVLLRSPGPCAEAFVREFRRFGIPLQAKRAGFFSAQEIEDLINLLRLLDNPRQDIPLLAVLHSPIVGLSAEELGWLRADDRDESIWRCLTEFVAEDEENDLRRKLNGFLKSYYDWRALARQSSLSHCLEVILEQTHYESLLLIDNRGAERIGNIRRLLDLARQYDPFQRQGLHRFVRFVDAQRDADLDLEPAPPSVTDAVTLMSIHQSKGLEFPVVVAAGLGRKFNEQDVNAAMVVDEKFGVCLHVHPYGPEQRYLSLPLHLARQRRRRELRAEEMRLLYVACTRARDWLILSGSVRSSLEKFGDHCAKELSPHSLTTAARMTDWVFPWLGRQIHEGQDDGITDCFRWEFWSAQDERLRPHTAAETTTRETLRPEPFFGVDVEALSDRIEFVYPHEGATVEAAKTSVSVLRRRAADIDEVSRPRFMAPRIIVEQVTDEDEGKMSATDRGNLHHSFLQKIDLSRSGSPQELRSQANRLRELGLFTEAEFVAMDYEALAEFWVSPLGRQIRESAGRVERELPFTVRLHTDDLHQLQLVEGHLEMATGDFVVVQGVVDLALITEDEVLILDYKTDSVTAENVETKLRSYAPQLRLYAHALKNTFRKKNATAWLHFLDISQSHQVDLTEKSAV